MIIVTLTTIPSRLPHLNKVISAIQNQSMKPDSIQLYLPREYSKRSLGKIDPSKLPEGVEIVWVDSDLGPATKILPATAKYINQPDTKLIYCDDDKIYDPKWIERLVKKSEAHPKACIVENGWNLKSRLHKIYWHKRPLLYKTIRLLSLGRFKAGAISDGSIQIAEGCGGVLVKPYFFSKETFEIPDILWSVDDVWLSGWLAINKIKIVKTDKSKSEGGRDLVINNQSIGRLESLYNYVYSGANRLDADEKCITYMQKIYSIWN